MLNSEKFSNEDEWISLGIFRCFTYPNVWPPVDVDDVVLGDLLLVHAQGPSGGGGSGLLDE